MSAITQKELAERLGMSRQNVGNALNGNPRVSAKTRQRVIEAARHYGYSAHSNHEARALIARRYGKRVRHDLIAIVMGDNEGQPMRDMPYFEPIFRGIEEAAMARGVDVALHRFRAKHLPRYIEEKRVDGVIGFASLAERNHYMYEDGLPVVSIGSDQHMASSLVPDIRAGMALVTVHLANIGHQRIAFLGHDEGRETAFRDSMKDLGLPAISDLVVSKLPTPYAESGTEGINRLVGTGTHFTAVVCHNDTIAMGAIECLQSHGLQVPGDVSVTGFDDISREYRFVPAVTSVAFDRQAMGRRAVSVFYEILDKMDVAEPAEWLPLLREVFPVELAAGGSTGPVRKKI